MLQPRLPRSLFASIKIACFLIGSLLVSIAAAADATLMQADLTKNMPGERPGLLVEAHYEFDLPQPLIEALHRGIPLYFVHEFKLLKHRWYWFNKKTIDTRFIIRLSFNPLTRRYAVSYNGLSLNFDTLDQALPFIKNIRRWRVASDDAIQNAEDYSAELRFFLDTEKLPKPMQVTNEDSVDWTVSSGWHNLPISQDVITSAE